jgi:alginate O-acetyltransferase complex protein AlgJ
MHNTEKATLEEWVAGLATVVVMFGGLWQAVQALSSPDLREVPHEWSDMRSGVSSDRFSKFLDTHLPIREDLIAWANTGGFVITQGAGDQVRLGRNEWLFSVEELQYFPGADEFQAARVRKVVEVSDRLNAKGIQLLVVVVPDKARVHASQLASGTYPAWYAQRYPSLVQALKAGNVQTVDAWPSMAQQATQQALYYRTDTHWNQAGARLVAELTAKHMLDQGAIEPQVSFATTAGEGAAAERIGDLLNMMGMSKIPNLLRPNPDMERADHTTKTSANPAASLLGDVSMPVTLVGTSYSQRANFHGYLQAALNAEVLNVATDGGGFIQSLSSYLKDDSFQMAPPQWLIWEVPERVFSAPLTDAEKAPLPL